MLYIYISTVHNNLDYNIVFICYTQTPFFHIIILTRWIARPICCRGTQIWPSHDGIWSQVNLVQLGNISANADPSARSMACTFHAMRISKRPWVTWMTECQRSARWFCGSFLELLRVSKIQGLMAWELLVGFENRINLVLGGKGCYLQNLRTIIIFIFI